MIFLFACIIKITATNKVTTSAIGNANQIIKVAFAHFEKAHASGNTTMQSHNTDTTNELIPQPNA